MKGKGEILKICILDPNSPRMYEPIHTSKIRIDDKKNLARAFVILKKYGVDLEEIVTIMKEEQAKNIYW